MTYQRNISRLSLLTDDLLDDVLPDQIVRIEIDADHHAGDQHDNRSLNHLRLTGPVDLLELRPRLGDEAAALAALRAGLAFRRLRARTDLRLALARALGDAAAALRLGLAARAPLRPRLPCHYRVSR